MMLFLSLIVALALPAQSPTRAPVLPSAATARLEWLVGCWVGERTTTRESWSRAGSKMLVAVKTTGVPGGSTAYAFPRIEETSDGSLVLIVQNPGERPERFTLNAAASAPALTFIKDGEPSHRVSYERGKKGDTFVVRVSADGGASAGISMKKADCK